MTDLVEGKNLTRKKISLAIAVAVVTALSSCADQSSLVEQLSPVQQDEIWPLESSTPDSRDSGKDGADLIEPSPSTRSELAATVDPQGSAGEVSSPQEAETPDEKERGGSPELLPTLQSGLAPVSNGSGADSEPAEPTPPDSEENSSSEVVLDPDAGGSAEVVYPEPEEAEVDNPTKLDAPGGLTITSLGETQVGASFEPNAAADRYHAYIRYGDSFTSKGLGEETSVIFEKLTPDWNYTLCVSYFSGEVESNRSCLAVHTLGERPVEPTPPAAPSNIQLSATENSISVSWDSVEGASGYRVCHVRGDNSWQCGGYRQITATSVIFDDGSIFPATLYGISVVAVDEEGNASQPGKASITTPGEPPAEPELLPGPENIRIEGISSTSVRVSWDYLGESEISVWTLKIRRLTSYSSIGVAGASRSFVVENLYSSTGYEVILSGRNASGTWTTEARQGFFTPAD